VSQTNTELVLRALEEVAGWVGPGSSLDALMEQVAHYDRLTPQQRSRVKFSLSRDGLFHIRALGDRDVPGFVGDGTAYAWWNYLGKIADICQQNL